MIFFLLPVQVGVSLSESPGLVAWPVRPSLLDGPSLVNFRVSPERDEGSCVMTCHEEHFDEGHLFMSKSCVRTPY